eukprot:359660-Chlamydomonas_euryale.AAC.22
MLLQSCVFLLPDNKCSIHSVRPGQCSTYPWWPELMDGPGWNDEKHNVCEGFDHEDSVLMTDAEVVSAALQLKEATVQDQKIRLAASQRTKRPW